LTREQLIAIIVFAVCETVVLCGFFAIFKIYRLLTNNFGMLEAIKVAVISLLVFMMGWVVMRYALFDYLPPYKLSVAFLGAITLMFLCVASRISDRVLSLMMVRARKRKNQSVRTLVVGGWGGGQNRY
jgi:FlaA1/EpsC-like NDP-sugar epimerase